MNEQIDKMVDTNLIKEMRESFLDYSMSVIVARAIPDVRDGLKPVHRRILYTLYEEGMTPDKKHQKSANAVGAVMGHYHPHGDAAIYDSMVRMAQPFTYRHTLVDGHGNFGNIDGDGAAASRYTEAKLSKISMELLRDINKDTIDFVDNYDGQRKEPTVLPSRFPNILVNGNMGIAVGMATNIPSHNLGEVIDGCVAYIDNPDITAFEMMQYIKGPDFPSGGIILGSSGIKQAYETGRGSIVIRSKAEIEEHNGKNRIIITELPYQVNKKELIVKMAELFQDKVIEGVSGLTDESALGGVRIVIDVKKEANANVILNNLYKRTALQTNYGINFLMLVDGTPRTLGIIDIIKYYINFQKSVIYRRTKFNLEKAEARAHLLEGCKIALDHIDEVIKIIKNAESDETAKSELMKNFGFSDVQAEYILELKLRRLTGMERDKIEAELAELLKEIEYLKGVLADDNKILGIIKEEMLEIKGRYADERKTYIDNTAIDFIEDESLIPVQSSILTITKNNYIKRIAADTYKSQHRGGVGIKGMTTNEEDIVDQLIFVSSHDYILFFSNTGRVYRLKGYEVPEFSRTSKGLPLVNLLQLEKDEKINTVVKIENETTDKYLVFVTKNGVVKRTAIEEFDSIRKSGKIAITLREDDELISVIKTDGSKKIFICSTDGRMARFDESEIRIMGRTASGVRGINLSTEDKCVGAEALEDTMETLVVTEKGYGKRTDVKEYRETKRGSKGVKTINITEKNGKVVGFKSASDDKDLMITTNKGMIIRLNVESISKMGRVTQGVRLINLKDDNLVSAISIVDKKSEEDQIEELIEENQTEPVTTEENIELTEVEEIIEQPTTSEEDI